MKYKSARSSAGEIASELGADFLLEGSVRNAGSKVRVTAQLIRAADESHMWAGNYDRELDDPLAVQIEICDLIANALALNLLPREEPSGSLFATDPQTYDLYFRASSLLADPADRDAVVRARDLFSAVIARDPGFARAYVGLARAHTLTDNSRESRGAAREALGTALALDESLPEAHLALAMMRFYQDYDVEGARESLERAIEINPGYAEAHQALAAYYSVTGRHDRAIAAVQQARRIDPLSSMVGSDVGWYYYFARRFDEAIEHSERTLALDPGFYWAELCIQLSLLQQRDWPGLVERGREQILRADPTAAELARLDGDDPENAARIIWEWRLRQMQHGAGQRWIAPADLAQLQMALGQPDEALRMLEESFEARSGWLLPFLVVDPLFDSLRGDSRFDDLVARIAGNGLRASR
jgi:tetratricopeptide (TPR) repeat protein